MKRAICNNFLTNSCRFGGNCKFLHEAQQKPEGEIVVDEKVRYMNDLLNQFARYCRACQQPRFLVVLSCGCEQMCGDCAKTRKECFEKHEMMRRALIVGRAIVINLIFIMQEIHYLNDEWAFWYAIRGKLAKDAQHYEENLKNLGTIYSVEDFFSYYCFLMRPSEMPHNHKLMLFRKGCKPLWEEWKDGGCWIWLSNKKDQQTLLDRKWQSLLFACIGESFESSQVVGVVLSKRQKHTLLEVWIDTKNEAMKMKLGQKINQLLNLQNDQLKFHFKDHNISLKERSTMRGSQKHTFKKTPLQTPQMPPIEQEAELQNFELQ